MIADADGVRKSAQRLVDDSDLDPLVGWIGDRRCVLLGEASHGTHEYYAWRAALTRRLILDHGFSLVATEADSIDCLAVDRIVRLRDDAPADPGAVLDGIRHWPSWLWANTETVDFCRWLRAFNADRDPDRRVGWHGLDGYPMWAATRLVIAYLNRHRPDLVVDSLDGNAEGRPMVPAEHLDHVVALLVDRLAGVHRHAPTSRAEQYFRALLTGGRTGWNARDLHWSDTLQALLADAGPDARAVIWAHNSHIGDARSSDQSDAGMLNIGQLVRERYGRDEVALVGFAGGAGRVVAAHRRGAPMHKVRVPPPARGSLEALLSRSDLQQALFLFTGKAPQWATIRRPHRAIGVVLDDGSDATYLSTIPAERYDALLWFARTTPVRALHLDAAERGELESWWPSAEPVDSTADERR